jgi:hypothetical protein
MPRGRPKLARAIGAVLGTCKTRNLVNGGSLIQCGHMYRTLDWPLRVG